MTPWVNSVPVCDEHAEMLEAFCRAEYGMTYALALMRGVMPRRRSKASGITRMELLQRAQERTEKP